MPANRRRRIPHPVARRAAGRYTGCYARADVSGEASDLRGSAARAFTPEVRHPCGGVAGARRGGATMAEYRAECVSLPAQGTKTAPPAARQQKSGARVNPGENNCVRGEGTPMMNRTCAMLLALFAAILVSLPSLAVKSVAQLVQHVRAHRAVVRDHHFLEPSRQGRTPARAGGDACGARAGTAGHPHSR